MDENYIILSPDVAVSEELSRRLQEWRFDYIMTDGVPLDSPKTGEVDISVVGSASIEKNLEEVNRREKVHTFLNETAKFFTDLFDRFQQKGEININNLSSKIKDIVSLIKEDQRFLLTISSEELNCQNYIICHTLKTTILCLILTDYLKFPPHKQMDMGLAAALHKIGMLKIPNQIYLSNKTLTVKDKQTLRAAPILAYKILKALNYQSHITNAILEHTENIDGSGYPRGLTADKISVYGKILAVVSAYEAAIARRPYKLGLDRHSGIMDLLKNAGKKYDETIVRSLVILLSLFPIGTYVLLSDQSKGIVIKTDQKNPKYPTIKLLLKDDNSLYLEQPILQTSEQEKIQIARPLNHIEIDEVKKLLRA